MRRCIVFAACLIAAPVYGLTLDGVLSKVENRESGLTAIGFAFSQQIKFSEAGMESRVEGQALIQKPDHLRIEKSKPHRQITISDGSKVWIYTPAFKQVWTGAWKDWSKGDALTQGIVPLQDYVSGLKENFNLSLIDGDPEDGTVSIQAKPKKDRFDYKLNVSFSTDSWLPVQTVFVSDSATVTTDLREISVNPELSSDTFRFEAPEGTDIIDLH